MAQDDNLTEDQQPSYSEGKKECLTIGPCNAELASGSEEVQIGLGSNELDGPRGGAPGEFGGEQQRENDEFERRNADALVDNLRFPAYIEECEPSLGPCISKKENLGPCILNTEDTIDPLRHGFGSEVVNVERNVKRKAGSEFHEAEGPVVKRIKNPYQYFYPDGYKRVLSENPALKGNPAALGEISKLVAGLWSGLSRAEKLPYVTKFETDREQYRQEKQQKSKKLSVEKACSVVSSCMSSDNHSASQAVGVHSLQQEEKTCSNVSPSLSLDNYSASQAIGVHFLQQEEQAQDEVSNWMQVLEANRSSLSGDLFSAAVQYFRDDADKVPVFMALQDGVRFGWLLKQLSQLPKSS